MTDKMPATGQASNFAALRFPLLHAIFAEMKYALVECIANVSGGAGFRSTDQRNFVFAPTSSFRRARNAFSNAQHVFLNDVDTHHEFFIVARQCNMAACGCDCSGEPVRLDCRTDYSPLYDTAR